MARTVTKKTCLTQRLALLICEVSRQFGIAEPADNCIGWIEEELTPEESDDVHSFLQWAYETKTMYGLPTIKRVWAEWRAA